ncbi:thioesterase superfamily protein [Brevibacterium sanguinis]|uniref:Thioesterase superfamily protein n=2 Tax=Brevibacterium TaxID=1696 RepID=A0A366IPI0_9MICO|nr:MULTISPECIES: thioesterase family protein [Brevibacterium]RBP66998.1 thioesterase superfamily protein [Brevibacterium sanguinis]RBP73523.1 thioesterase superfamily protein [Brevibacterium celere]
MPAALNQHLGHDGSDCPDSYYVRTGGDRLHSTLHSQGAWQPGEQHMAPASGLVLAEVERRLPTDKVVSRVAFDILGVIHSGEFTVDVEVTRPGRTIELVEARMRHGDRTSVHARVWRLQSGATGPIEGHEWAGLPAPEDMREVSFQERWGGGFIASLEARQDEHSRPGHARSWIRAPFPLVAGEPDPPTAEFVKHVDVANGMAVREDPRTTFFPNIDLTIHLTRQPRPGWVGFETRVAFGPTGLGETASVLSDEAGPIGTAAQSLTVRTGEGTKQ